MNRIVISCSGNNIVGDFSDQAACELVKRKIVDYSLSKNELMNNPEKYKDLLKHAKEIMTLESCPFLCASKTIVQYLPHKEVYMLCLPKQGFSAREITKSDDCLERLMQKLSVYFSQKQPS